MQINPVKPIGSERLSSTVPSPEHRDENVIKLTPQTETRSTEDISKALAEIAKVIEPFKIDLKFSKDDETGRIVVQMIDQDSGETVQQFPTRATLQVAAILSKLQGQFVDCKA